MDRIEIERFSDRKLDSVLDSAGTAAGEAAAATGGEGLMDTGEELGDDGLDAEPDAAEETGEDAGAPDEEGGPLLAEPATRDDWYQPVTDPAWKQGARKRSYLSSAGTNTASSSRRNLFKGWSGEMGPLSRGVVGEGAEHSNEEKIISEAQSEIKKLIKQLEEKDEKTAQ